MAELSFIIDELTGTLLVEDTAHLGVGIRAQLTAHLGEKREMGCARPRDVLPPPVVSVKEEAKSVCVRINGYYHNSLCEGPGRRSSVLFQSCPLRCKGCWVTHLHSEDAGELVPVTRLAAELLDPDYERDGVAYFAQNEHLFRNKQLLKNYCHQLMDSFREFALIYFFLFALPLYFQARKSVQGTAKSCSSNCKLMFTEVRNMHGVSILGGEPFAQADALLALIKELRQKGCNHILCYSGYTLEALCEKGIKQESISAVLNEIDILIDGAYVESLAAEAGEWTGSGNQRVIDLRKTRKSGEVVIF